MWSRIILLLGLLSFSSAWAPPTAIHLASPRQQHRLAQKVLPTSCRTTVACRVQANHHLEDPTNSDANMKMFEAEAVFANADDIVQKVINGAVLALCFGYAFYTIFNIDHGMTRGWTQSEIAMRIPLDNWSSYESALLEKPVMTKTFINVVIYLLGDWLSQTLFQKKHVLDFDVKRTLRNGFIGLCFGPLVHQYYEFSDTILPVEGGWMNRIEKILMDQTIYLTVKCSIYISAVGLLAGEDWKAVQKNVKERIVPVVFTAWKFWPLVHCITYGLVPARHRILWVNCVDLIWNAILASKAREPVADDANSNMENDESTSPGTVTSLLAEVAATTTANPVLEGEDVEKSSEAVIHDRDHIELLLSLEGHLDSSTSMGNTTFGAELAATA